MSESATTILTAYTTPLANHIAPNDKIVRRVFDLDKDERNELEHFGDTTLLVDEKLKKREAITEIALKIADEYQKKPFVGFDREVFTVCLSMQTAGNTAFTVNQIYHALGGGKDHTPEKVRVAIEESLEKMMRSFVVMNVEDLARKSNYKFDKYVYEGPILPLDRRKFVLNGQVVEGYFFMKESPLFEVAKIKRQILTYPAELMKLKRLRFSLITMPVHGYIIRRVMEYCAHSKNLTNRILFSECYKICGVDEPNKKQKLTIREYVERTFNNLVDIEYLRGYDFVKKGGNIYHAVDFYPINIT